MSEEMFAELETLRRQRDWTYQQLADAIAKQTNRRRDQDCWRKICQGQTLAPQARTLDILENFLESVRPRRRRA